ncbi:MAG: hypothetical protein AB7F86_05375 [Bdellovibrionales bacterium]
MYRKYLRLGAASVLVSGLISCSQQSRTPETRAKTKLDVVQAGSPEIVRGDERIPMKDWDQVSNRHLDLHDQLEFSGAEVKKIRIESDCVLTGQGSPPAAREVVEFATQKSIFIHQLLADEVLIRELSDDQSVCHFKFMLENERGSKRIFDLRQVILAEKRKSDLELNFGPHLLGEEILRLQQLSEIWVKELPLTSGTSLLLCPAVVSVGTPLDKVKPLAAFAGPGFPLKDRSSQGQLMEEPIQNCRLRLLSGEASMISKRFLIMFPRPPTSVGMEMHYRDPNPQVWHKGELGELSAGRQITIGVYRVQNPAEGRRWVRFPKAGPPMRLEGRGTTPKSAFYPTGNSATQVRDEAGFWVVQIEPGQAASFEFRLAAQEQVSPRGSYVYVFSFLDRIPVQEIDSKGRPLHGYTFDVGSPVVLRAQ